ncbi:UPF0114 protein in repA1-repA2 intergenic region-like [Zingiber officinale]|uniref:Uncharacterized protein n=1 Tax=Zingiber officinale TaxID=94328 RepID=A0A8J5GCB3_ZINOF|nr:UPF0114 protein in repA1-repA2 intergenic region-like [Zingiber officinale]KAG6505665.1 hypothetical protein ZIOFF_038030 [Zingiber officinale]
MKSLRLALPRLEIYGTLTSSEIGHRIVRIASFAPVKASSDAEVTSVSCSDIAPVPEARPSLRRTPLLASRGGIDDVEEKIEKVIYKCRFFAFLAVAGSLMGSVICFIKGCTYVIDSFREYFVSGGKVILMLVEAIDVYLVGTVMLVFGMGLYELFISNLDIAKMSSHGSNLLGLFKLMERPRWLEIQSVNELKTKLGHVIVMVLLVGMFEKSKKVTISTPTDLLYFAASILLSSGCLYLLSKLQSTKRS